MPASLTEADTERAAKPSLLPPENKIPWVPIISLSVLLFGLIRAIHFRWVTDDAFITFRYVKNFLAGLGPVYNPGEHVEGYTHFLWLLLLSACGWLGIDPVDASIWMGITAYLRILGVFLLIAKREADLEPRSASSWPAYFPIAATLIALNYDMAMWASGGLETALYTFLIPFALYTWFYSKLVWHRRLLCTGALLFLITLTRPDGALFTLTAIGSFIFKERRDKISSKVILRESALLLLPSIALGIPYLLWKFSFYGDIFPTTYYAKSGSGGDFGPGIFYVLVFVRMYWSSALGFAILPLAAYFLNLKRKSSNSAGVTHLLHDAQIGRENNSLGSPLITAIIAVLVYLILFVVRLGGDFMVSRFIIPVLPLIYFVIEKSIRKLHFHTEGIRWGIAATCIVSLVIENSDRDSIIKVDNGLPLWRDHNLSDERFGYIEKNYFFGGRSQNKMQLLSAAGRYFEPFFRGIPASVVQDSACMFVYYANFENVIEKYGLTDAYISHLPVSRPGKIGHEKVAPMDYLIQRGVMFSIEGGWYPIGSVPAKNAWDLAWFEVPDVGIMVKFHVVKCDTAVFSELIRRFRSANANFFIPDFKQIIPEYTSRVLPNSSYSVAAADYNSLKSIYFSRYPDPSQQQQIETTIAGKKELADSATKALSLSLEYYKAQRYADCIAAARKAATFEPDLSAAYNNMCASYIQLADFDEAITTGEEAVRLDPRDNLAKNNLINAIEQRKKNPWFR